MIIGLKSFPHGHWSNGLFVTESTDQQTRYTRIFGAIVWPRMSAAGVVMAMGERYMHDPSRGTRVLRLIGEERSEPEKLEGLLDKITDLARVLIIERFFCREKDIEHYLQFYRDTFRRLNLRAPSLIEAPYDGDTVLGDQLTRSRLSRLGLEVPEQMPVWETLREARRIDFNKPGAIEHYPELAALYMLVLAFYKQPWAGANMRRRPRTYSKPLDKVAGY